MDMKEAIQVMVDSIGEGLSVFTRGMDRFSIDTMTSHHLFTDVRKLKETPVSGDVIATISQKEKNV